MRTIGLLGGMSWESSIEYYRVVNERVRERLGGYHSARSIMFSFDFHDIEELQHAGDWDQAADRLVDAARRVEAAGAELLVLCTNTMHRLADEVQAAIGIPLVHIADATAQAIRRLGTRRVGLLGTRYTMEQDFYRGRLARHGLEVLVPERPALEAVHRIIYEELVRGVVRPESRALYLEAIDALAGRDADAVVLGCTEIELLVRDGDARIPLLETARIHAETAADAALDRTDLPAPHPSRGQGSRGEPGSHCSTASSPWLGTYQRGSVRAIAWRYRSASVRRCSTSSGGSPTSKSASSIPR
jgi:aspartate racemase